MKLLHVETGRHLYGGPLQVYYLIRGLHARGIKNILVCPPKSRILEAAKSFAACHPAHLLGDMDIRLLGKLLYVIHEEKPDIIHIHSRRGADWWGGVAAGMTGTPSIVTRRVDNPENRRLAALKYKRYDRIVVISEAICRVLIRAGIDRSNIKRIHSAVDHSGFRQPCDRQWFNQTFGLDDALRPIGTIAQLIDRKGHRFLLDAVPAIVDKHPQARFLFFGQGPLEADLKAVCRRMHIAEYVLFCGFRDDMHRILPCLEMVVHPATMEGLGVALLQSAAAGKPIVAGNAGGIPEIVTHAENGFLTPTGDAAAIARYVNLLLDDSQRRCALGRAARERVLSHFSIDSMVDQYIIEYKRLLER